MVAHHNAYMAYVKVQQAIRFAIECHEGAFRDGQNGLPYCHHPIEVAGNLRYIGGILDEELLCAAVLHDVLEETDITPKQLKLLFGNRIYLLVKELTRIEPSDDETKGLSKVKVSQLRTAQLLSEIAKMSPEAQSVKLADRLSNLKEAKVVRKGDKLKRYLKQTEKILEIIPKSVNPTLWKAVNAELP
jgi:(p)ppGpp synthase/HD superfamily hydrolase